MKSKIRLSNTTKITKPKKPSFPIQLEKGTAVLFCSDSSAISDKLHVVLLSAVTLKCNIYRTVFLKKPLTIKRGRRLLEKWSETLPLKKLIY